MILMVIGSENVNDRTGADVCKSNMVLKFKKDNAGVSLPDKSGGPGCMRYMVAPSIPHANNVKHCAELSMSSLRLKNIVYVLRDWSPYPHFALTLFSTIS